MHIRMPREKERVLSFSFYTNSASGLEDRTRALVYAVTPRSGVVF
jgi:hypothetical protein